MTEDIGSDKHKRPSSAEIEVAERMAVMRERIRQSDARDLAMNGKMDIIIGKLSQIETNLALGNQRFDKIEDNAKALKEDTTTRLSAIEADRRSTAGIIAGTISGIGTVATAIWVAIKG